MKETRIEIKGILFEPMLLLTVNALSEGEMCVLGGLHLLLVFDGAKMVCPEQVGDGLPLPFELTPSVRSPNHRGRKWRRRRNLKQVIPLT